MKLNRRGFFATLGAALVGSQTKVPQAQKPLVTKSAIRSAIAGLNAKYYSKPMLDRMAKSFTFNQTLYSRMDSITYTGREVKFFRYSEK